MNYTDTSGDDLVERDEFEEIKKNKPNLNQTLIKIFDTKFQTDSNSKVTYERK